MHSLGFERSSSARARTGSQKWLHHPLVCGAAALALATACGEDDDGASTVALADSAAVTNLQNGDLGIPTTVAVRDGIAWVAESQFDRYSRFNPMAGPPGDFRLVGIPLAGGSAREIDLPPNFYPEGVTASRGGQLFVGSVEDGSIMYVEPGSETAEPFVNGELLNFSALGMAVGGSTLWVCDSDPTNQGDGASALVGIDIAGRMPVGAHLIGPSDTSLCNDVVVAESGALWFTDSFNGRIYRVAPEDIFEGSAAEIWLESDLLRGTAESPFGVNGITLAGGRLFVVNSTSGTLYSIDPALDAPSDGDLTPIALREVSPEGDVLESDLTLTGPDGVTRLSDGELLIVENGLGAPANQGKRVVHVRLGAP